MNGADYDPENPKDADDLFPHGTGSEDGLNVDVPNDPRRGRRPTGLQ